METMHQLSWTVGLALLLSCVLPTGGGDMSGKRGLSRDSVFYEWWLRRLNTAPQDVTTKLVRLGPSGEGSPVVPMRTTLEPDVTAGSPRGETMENPTQDQADRLDSQNFLSDTEKNETIMKPSLMGNAAHINDSVLTGFTEGNYTLKNESNSVAMENLTVCDYFSEDLGNTRVNGSSIDAAPYISEELTNGTKGNNVSLSRNVSGSFIQQNLSRNTSHEIYTYKCVTTTRLNNRADSVGNVSRETDYLPPEVGTAETRNDTTDHGTRNSSTHSSIDEKEQTLPHLKEEFVTGRLPKSSNDSSHVLSTTENESPSEADTYTPLYQFQPSTTTDAGNTYGYSRQKSIFQAQITSTSPSPKGQVTFDTGSTTLPPLTQPSTKLKEVPREGLPLVQSEQLSTEDTSSVQLKSTTFLEEKPSVQADPLSGEQTSKADQSDTSDTTPAISTGYMYPTTEFDPFSNRGGPFLRKPNAYDFLMMGQIATVKKTEAQREFTESNLEASAMICAMFNKDFCRLSIGGRCC